MPDDQEALITATEPVFGDGWPLYERFGLNEAIFLALCMVMTVRATQAHATSRTRTATADPGNVDAGFPPARAATTTTMAMTPITAITANIADRRDPITLAAALG